MRTLKNYTDGPGLAKTSSLHPCPCGGRYSLGFAEDGTAMLFHTLPFCQRYNAATTTADAVRYSTENRKQRWS